MKLIFNATGLDKYMLDGEFGLERETLRVDANGRLSQTPHPFPNDPDVSRDFCENQVEIITGVSKSAKGAIDELAELDGKVTSALLELESGEEYLWRFSNPPFISGEDEIPVARFRGAQKHKEVYREYLAEKYGKKKMLFSGIHCNFSFSDEFVENAFRQSCYDDLRSFKNDLYLKLGAGLTKYSWLIVYLTAASPVMDSSFLGGKKAESKYASARCSEIGYWNDFIPVLSYESLEDYVHSIYTYIDTKQLIAASELYYPVRLKPAGENTLEHLLNNGINHVELRMLDVNPLCREGVFETDLNFIQLLAVYLTSVDEDDFSESDQINAVKNMKAAAEFDHKKINISVGDGYHQNIKKAALEVIENMEIFFSQLDAPPEVHKVLQTEKEKIVDPSRRYAEMIKKMHNYDFTEKGLELSKAYVKLQKEALTGS